MKIVDLADQIFRELGEPAELTLPAITYWVRSNVGGLNNYLNTSFTIDDDTLEFDPVLSLDESVVFKKMYMIHFYDLKIRKNINVVETETIIAVSDGEQSVTKINKNQVTIALTNLKRAEESELHKLIASYKFDKSAPRQIAGDDTEQGRFGQTRYNHEFNRIN
jgi:hypothetical protein